ncbi:MAG: hypothetical protein OMM_13617, partial [Candidatus Magnetoglobus multicellularis str. Araruama]
TLSGDSGGMTYSYVTITGGEPLTLTILPLTNENGILDITVTVSDGIVDVSESFTLTVMPVNDAPALSGASFSLTENSPTNTSAGNITCSDIDGDPLTLTIISGNTGAAFVINNSGEITVNNGNALDYEASSTFSLTVEVSDGSLTDVASVSINLLDVNEAPDLAAINDLNIDEDTTASIAMSVTDVEADTLTLTISSSDASIVDGNSISVNGTSGYIHSISTGSVSTALALTVTPMSNMNGTLTLTIQVADSGSLTAQTFFMLTVDSVNDSPTISGASFSITENSPTNTSVGSIAYSDIDGEPLTLTIINGNNDSAFAINNSGEISVNDGNVLNYESQNSYTLTVEVSDGSLTDTSLVLINLSDVNESPEISSISDVTIDEDAPTGISFTASDPEMSECMLDITIT